MASPIPLDPYEVLGVARDATLSAIRSAHRKLVLKYHPDRIKDDADRQKGTEEFQKAQQAYELLSDEKRRTRYDDQVKLAALRKEAMMADRAVPMRSSTFPVQTHATGARPPPPPPPSAYEYRDGRMYEERRPRYPDEDERWAEPQLQRPSARKAASTYERRPTSSYKDEKTKKHSEKPTGFTEYMQSKLKEKAKQARERAAHTESAKHRDKERRRDTEAKHSSRRAYVESDDDSSSGSDTITYVSRNPTPKKSEPRKPEPRRRATYEVPPTPTTRKSRESERMRASRENTESSSDSDSSTEDEDEDEWARRHRDATAYISERSVAGRPGVLRTDSAHYIAPKEKISGRKSGSDKDDLREERTRSSRARRPPPIEVVEPPRRSPQSRKAPSMATANSSPAGLKGMTGHREAPQPHRSSTGDYPTDHKRPVPSMKRAETMPVPPISTRRESGRGSKLKQSETMDSGYGSSSPATPEMRGTSPPKSSSKKYFIVEEDAEHARASYRTVPIPEEEYPSRRTRSPSPPRERERDRDGGRKRERPERPTVQTSASYAKGTRSSNYTTSPDQMSARPSAMRTESTRSAMRGDAPPLARGESGRHLYGEVNKEDGYRFAPENVRYSPKTGDVRYTHTRRGSDDRNKDYFSGSSHHDNLHSPRNGRRESVY